MAAEEVTAILNSMGVESADPQVAVALMEYANRVASTLLCDSKDYANHAGHADIEVGDAKTAVAMTDMNIMSQDPREKAIKDVKPHVNAIDLSKAVDDKTFLHRYPKDPTASLDPTKSLLQRTYTIVPSTEGLEEQQRLGGGQANQTDSFQPMQLS